MPSSLPLLLLPTLRVCRPVGARRTVLASSMDGLHMHIYMGLLCRCIRIHTRTRRTVLAYSMDGLRVAVGNTDGASLQSVEALFRLLAPSSWPPSPGPQLLVTSTMSAYLPPQPNLHIMLSAYLSPNQACAVCLPTSQPVSC